jgi:Trypsin-co-occurring domain 2
MSEADRTQGSEIELADMIETLRQELESAQIKGMQRSVAFGVEKVELELKVVLSRTVKGGGGIKFWVLSAEGSTEGSRETTHNFKLTLLPLDPETKKRLEIASKTSARVDKTK